MSLAWGGTVPTTLAHVSQLTALLRVCIFNQLLEGEVEEGEEKYGHAIVHPITNTKWMEQRNFLGGSPREADLF